MPRVSLSDLVYVRSGDKGANANIGVIVKNPEHYDTLAEQLTEQRVADLYDEFLDGEVHRYDLPNISCFNFVLTDVLDGGGLRSLRIDAQGKALCEALLQLDVEMDDTAGAGV